MTRSETTCTSLNTVGEVWNIWASNLPIVWHNKAAQIAAILTPPDDHDKVLCAIGGKRYFLVDLVDLRRFDKGSAVSLKDGRVGVIESLTRFASLFLFRDTNSGLCEMVPVESVSAVNEESEIGWLSMTETVA